MMCAMYIVATPTKMRHIDINTIKKFILTVGLGMGAKVEGGELGEDVGSRVDGEFVG